MSKNKELPILEFGRCVESCIFTDAINWFLSVQDIPEMYLQAVIDGVTKNNNLPEPNCLTQAQRRPPPMLMAIDYMVEARMICS